MRSILFEKTSASTFHLRASPRIWEPHPPRKTASTKTFHIRYNPGVFKRISFEKSRIIWLWMQPKAPSKPRSR